LDVENKHDALDNRTNISGQYIFIRLWSRSVNKTFIALLFGIVSSMLTTIPAVAQTADNTQTLPDAKPGECYAKVITPAKFTTRSEEVVVQDASERIKTVPAKFEEREQTVVISEASQRVTVVPATYTEETETVVLQPAENNWIQSGSGGIPASPGALEGIARSGIALASVEVGSCFNEYFTPSEYKTETQRIMTREASEKIVVIPAQYETVEERVVVKEAYTRSVDIPATYRSESESVLVEPARSVWKKGRGPIEKIDNTSGEIMCLVEIPARYETLTKTVLDKPATTKTVDVPAVYKTMKVKRLVKPATENRVAVAAEFDSVNTKVKVADAGFFWLKKGEAANNEARASGREVCLVEQKAQTRTVKKEVIKTPATTAVVDVPAQFETVKVSRLTDPATETRTTVPARTKTVTRQVQIAPSTMEWRRILCETNTTPELITSIQRALKREGYNPGSLDGVIGQATLVALEEYQTKENLDRGGLTYETLKSLKVQ